MVNRFDTVMLSLGLAVLIATPAAAGNCRTVHRCAPPVRIVERVITPVAVVEAVAVLPVLPVVSAFAPAVVQAYGATYIPGSGSYQQVIPSGAYAPPPPQAIPGATPVAQYPESFLTVLKGIEQRMVAMEQRMGVAAQQSQTPMPPADAPQTQPQAQAGNSLLAVLSAEKQREVLRRVYSTDTKVSMPRGGKPLTDEELSVVVGWVASSSPPAPELTKLFQTRCASCHQSGREGSGGGFVLTLK